MKQAGIILALIAAPLAAQEGPPPQPGANDIVVTATPDPEPDVARATRQARDISRARMVREIPLSRFQRPVCAGVIGLPEDLANQITARIYAVAHEAEVRIDETPGCTANLIVVFTVNGRDQVRAIASRAGSALANIPRAERLELLKEPGPVWAWSVTALRTRDGMNLRGRQEDGQVPLAWVQSGNSLFQLRTRLDIDVSVVAIDLAATEGLTLVQLADYAAMRGLVQTRPPEGAADYGTILTLFTSGARQPGHMTNFDLAFLKAAYSPVANLAAYTKLARVGKELEKLEESEGD